MEMMHDAYNKVRMHVHEVGHDEIECVIHIVVHWCMWLCLEHDCGMLVE
jgi:hypothetical protein